MSDRLQELNEIFGQELAMPNLRIESDTVLETIPGWDSVNMACIILAVERRYDLTLSSEQMDSLKTVADFEKLIV